MKIKLKSEKHFKAFVFFRHEKAYIVDIQTDLITFFVIFSYNPLRSNGAIHRESGRSGRFFTIKNIYILSLQCFYIYFLLKNLTNLPLTIIIHNNTKTL